MNKLLLYSIPKKMTEKNIPRSYGDSGAVMFFEWITKQYFEVDINTVIEMTFDSREDDKKLIRVRYLDKSKVDKILLDRYMMSSKYLTIIWVQDIEENTWIQNKIGIHKLDWKYYRIIDDIKWLFEPTLFNYFHDQMCYWINSVTANINLNNPLAMKVSFKWMEDNIKNMDTNFKARAEYMDNYKTPFPDWCADDSYEEDIEFELIWLLEWHKPNYKEIVIENIFKWYRKILSVIEKKYIRLEYHLLNCAGQVDEEDKKFLDSYLKRN